LKLSLFERLYSKIYIAIVEDGKSIDVAVEIFNGSKNANEISESFESLDELKIYIDDIISESPYFYISYLNTSADQGALPTCDKLKMHDFEDVSLSSTLCIDKKWVLFSSIESLKLIQDRHSSYGLDYIFSPFTILHNFFEDKIKEVFGLYVLVQNESLSMAVFSTKKLEFALHVLTDSDSIALMESESSESNDFELSEDIEPLADDDFGILDDIEALDDFESLDDIETLDDIENIESFEDFAEESNGVSMQEVEEKEESIEGFNLDFHRFTLIQDALKRFYKEEIYEQSFIEAVFIADGVGLSKDLKSYLEEELFVTPIVRNIDLAQELLKLSKDEVANVS
jgi:hypothetical protein